MVSSYCAPTIAKNISVDKTSYSAPSTKGLPKSAKLSIKPSKNAFAIPGLINGKVTVLKTCHLEALNVWEASSIDGLTLSTTPIKTKNAIGVKASVCANHIPGKP